jgi:hypothetical protein
MPKLQRMTSTKLLQALRKAGLYIRHQTGMQICAITPTGVRSFLATAVIWHQRHQGRSSPKLK